ncbi:MAG: hypothetical protein GTN78_08005, partial [Gemmatimonadales bacterium]|nr:hypothetical protein [Gemmatimonadales bacterium]
MTPAPETKARDTGAKPGRAEEVFEAMLLDLCAERSTEQILHAHLGSGKHREEVSTPFSHSDVHSFYEL